MVIHGSWFTRMCFIARVEMLLLSNNIRDYYFVSQGKTTIPGLDDGEELLATDVSAWFQPVQFIASSLFNWNICEYQPKLCRLLLSDAHCSLARWRNKKYFISYESYIH